MNDEEYEQIVERRSVINGTSCSVFSLFSVYSPSAIGATHSYVVYSDGLDGPIEVVPGIDPSTSPPPENLGGSKETDLDQLQIRPEPKMILD